MPEDLKRKLDDSVPEDVTLSETKKRQILAAAQNQNGERKQTRVPKLLPALAGVAVIGLGGILGYPYVSDWQEQGAVEIEKLEPEEFIVPGREYQVLIPSTYDDQSEELLYNDGNKIFSYDKSLGTETMLVDMDEGISSMQADLEGKWLAWGEYGEEISNLKILNRETEKIETIADVYIIDLQIEEENLIYNKIGGDEKPQYLSVDLKTMETTMLHEMVGDGAMSAASIWNSKLVVPEIAEEEGETVSNFYVYNLEDNTLIDKFTLPYATASGVMMNNGRIYAQFGNETMEDSLLGYLDIQTGEFTEIPTPDFTEFAVYEDYLALSVMKGEDSSDLQLYKMTGTELEELSAFADIEERLVKPRFTEEGTLVVNGEGEDLAMYLLDVAD